VIEVARKGILAQSILALVTGLLLATVGYLVVLILDGYFLKGTYRALVIPTLLAGLWSIWSLRRLIGNIFARKPLIFMMDGNLHYVARGHSTVSLAAIGSYLIEGSALRTLYLFEGTSGTELRHYPLFLSSSPNEEVVRNLTSIGLRTDDQQVV